MRAACCPPGKFCGPQNKRCMARSCAARLLSSILAKWSATANGFVTPDIKGYVFKATEINYHQVKQYNVARLYLLTKWNVSILVTKHAGVKKQKFKIQIYSFTFTAHKPRTKSLHVFPTVHNNSKLQSHH